MVRRNFVLSAVGFFIAVPLPTWAGETTLLKPGPWRAWLESPGGELPFGLLLDQRGVGWDAMVVNGLERINVPVVELTGDELILSIDYYDSTIRAKVSQDGTRLDGEWKKKGRGDEWSKLPFHAEAGMKERFPAEPSHNGAALSDSKKKSASEPIGLCESVEGKWSVKFEGSVDMAVGIFNERAGGRLTGTFLTSTGDYRFLAGRYDGGKLQLSTFDGAHAFLFHAECQADGTLQGDFWSRDAWHESWTASRDPNASLPDPFALTKPKEHIDLSQLRFPDADGTQHALSDPAFAGTAYVVDIFGTWCPNCYDASNFLNELHAKYRNRGLSIVGLAFELTGDFNRDARQVKRYAERHKIGYPVLVAGEAIREKVAERVPIIDQLRAYPTLVFITADGQVRGVYTGFAGPATGDTHVKMKHDIEALVVSMLGG